MHVRTGMRGEARWMCQRQDFKRFEPDQAELGADCLLGKLPRSCVRSEVGVGLLVLKALFWGGRNRRGRWRETGYPGLEESWQCSRCPWETASRSPRTGKAWVNRVHRASSAAADKLLRERTLQAPE